MSAPRPITPLGLLAGKLERVLAGVEAAGSVEGEVLQELREATALAAGLDPYLERCSSPESPELLELAAATRKADWGGTGVEQEMLSGHVEGRFLNLLVHASRARRVLELGLFTGYSALAMAEALPDDGELVACELDAEVAAFAERFLNGSDAGRKVEVKVGPGAATLEELAARAEPFDLVFIDADKGGYLAYLRTVLDGGLLAPHGLICVDNTLLQGEPYLEGEPSESGAAIRAFNQAVADDRELEQVLVPLRDGVTLIRRVA